MKIRAITLGTILTASLSSGAAFAAVAPQSALSATQTLTSAKTEQSAQVDTAPVIVADAYEYAGRGFARRGFASGAFAARGFGGSVANFSRFGSFDNDDLRFINPNTGTVVNVRSSDSDDFRRSSNELAERNAFTIAVPVAPTTFGTNGLRVINSFDRDSFGGFDWD